MHNGNLAADYIRRSALRLRAVETLYEAQAWADVVRECQEAVELALKGMLRAARVDVPRVHDVSAVLRQNAPALPEIAREHVEQLARTSRELRRDRELAFYATEDLVPSEFYVEEDASRALTNTRFVVETATAALETMR